MYIFKSFNFLFLLFLNFRTDSHLNFTYIDYIIIKCAESVSCCVRGEDARARGLFCNEENK